MQVFWGIRAIHFHIACEIYQRDYELHAKSNQHFLLFRAGEKKNKQARPA